MESINCSICGEGLNESYKQTLNCGHTFHYECLMLSFKTMKNTSCPYCRSPNNYYHWLMDSRRYIVIYMMLMI